VPPSEVHPAKYLARVGSVARFCEASNINIVRVDTVTSPDGPHGLSALDAEKRLVDVWQRAADQLASSGIQLVWEFEPGFWINRPSLVKRIVQDVDRPNFGVLFDSSHAHTIGTYGARQGPDPEILRRGAIEFASILAPHVRHLHLIDSDGSLHDGDTSEHLPFGEGEIDFPAMLDALGSSAENLPWWTVDFCFWPETVRDAALALPVVKELRDRFIHRSVQKEVLR
jgi:sugar phosphate isomerase/epimerase